MLIEATWPCKPEVGDLRLAESLGTTPAPPRLVYVAEVDQEHAVVTAALCSNEVEMLTNRDVRADKRETGLPFDLAIETDIAGSLWWAQIGKFAGRADPATIAAVSDVILGHNRRSDRRVQGIPVKGPSDSRWAFKQDELVALQALAMECAAWLADRSG